CLDPLWLFAITDPDRRLPPYARAVWRSSCPALPRNFAGYLFSRRAWLGHGAVWYLRHGRSCPRSGYRRLAYRSPELALGVLYQPSNWSVGLRRHQHLCAGDGAQRPRKARLV